MSEFVLIQLDDSHEHSTWDVGFLVIAEDYDGTPALWRIVSFTSDWEALCEPGQLYPEETIEDYDGWTGKILTPELESDIPL